MLHPSTPHGPAYNIPSCTNGFDAQISLLKQEVSRGIFVGSSATASAVMPDIPAESILLSLSLVSLLSGADMLGFFIESRREGFGGRTPVQLDRHWPGGMALYLACTFSIKATGTYDAAAEVTNIEGNTTSRTTSGKLESHNQLERKKIKELASGYSIGNEA